MRGKLYPHHENDCALRSISTLDCPDSQGDLTRKDVASTARPGSYADDDGDQVTLQLVDITGGDVKGGLAPIEAWSGRSCR